MPMMQGYGGESAFDISFFISQVFPFNFRSSDVDSNVDCNFVYLRNFPWLWL